MKGISKLIFLLTVLVSCNSEKDGISEPDKLTEKFFLTYRNDGPRIALKDLLLTNKYMSESVVDSVGLRLEGITREMGDLQGIEKIRSENYGDGIVAMTYVIKYSRQPIRFRFKFYQPGNGWRVQDFNFQTAFIHELDK